MLENIVRSFLYQPIVLPKEAPLPVYVRGAREVWIALESGIKIHGLYWPAPSNDRPVILYFHGNAQSVFEWALVREELAPVDCGLLLIDYPGYGKSEGRPGENALYQAGRASLSWLANDAGVPESSVVLLGKSLGGPVAVETARGRGVQGVVLESTFRSIPYIVKRLLPMIPAGTIRKSELYETFKRVESIGAPLLVIHGVADGLIPVSEGQALFDLATEPKELFLVPGAGHNDVSLVAGREYGIRIRNWLNSLAGATGNCTSCG